jgi:hypothetical protein
MHAAEDHSLDGKSEWEEKGRCKYVGIGLFGGERENAGLSVKG